MGKNFYERENYSKIEKEAYGLLLPQVNSSREPHLYLIAILFKNGPNRKQKFSLIINYLVIKSFLRTPIWWINVSKKRFHFAEKESYINPNKLFLYYMYDTFLSVQKQFVYSCVNFHSKSENPIPHPSLHQNEVWEVVNFVDKEDKLSGIFKQK